MEVVANVERLIDDLSPIGVDVEIRRDIEIILDRSEGEGKGDGFVGLMIGDIESVHNDSFCFCAV